jgi:5-methylcytosine-specific restriction protein A
MKFHMPYKPQHPCAHPGCAALTATRFCPIHAKADAHNYERYQRDPATRKRYGRSWAKVRAAFLASHPLCEFCERDGKITPAALVHHRIPLAEGGTNDVRNLCALCDSCHSAHHARDGSRWGI